MIRDQVNVPVLQSPPIDTAKGVIKSWCKNPDDCGENLYVLDKNSCIIGEYNFWPGFAKVESLEDPKNYAKLKALLEKAAQSK